MFRYTPISIVFVVLLLAAIIQVQYEDSSWWIILVPLVLYLIVLIIGSAKIGLNFFFVSLNKAKTTENQIAITFDDGPNSEITPKLLDLLEKEQLTATFYCTGQNAQTNPTILKKIHDNGHLVGNHSFSHHRFFDLFSSKKMTEEINQTNMIIEKTIGKKPKLFRPPYGVTNPNLMKAIGYTGMTSVGWSLRSFDTINRAETVLKKLKRKTSKGDVVLFHDNDPKILQIMEAYAQWLKKHNYKVVSLAQLFEIEAYEN